MNDIGKCLNSLVSLTKSINRGNRESTKVFDRYFLAGFTGRCREGAAAICGESTQEGACRDSHIHYVKLGSQSWRK